MILTKNDAQEILDTILSNSKATDVEVSINGGTSSNLRFARNTVTTSGTAQNVSIDITSTFGKKSGSYSANQFDDKTLEQAVKRAEELARLAPEDPEYLPPLLPQTYPEVKAYVEATAKVSPEYRATTAHECIEQAEENGLVAAGFIENGEGFSLFGNNKGLVAYHRDTSITYSVTARTKDGTGSGWASDGHNDSEKFNATAASLRAVEKGAASVNPKTVEPGKYTVVLEPEAVSNLLGNLSFRMDARSADEGRSFFSDVDGKNKIGQKLFPDFVNIYSDPAHPDAPGSPWSEAGMPSRKVEWIKNGTLMNLRYSRYWAQQKGKEPVPFPSNVIMEGGTASLEDLIASTDKGILVTRFWYIRDVDPKTVLLTGLTRDGVFWIEKGKITGPVKNFRFNESPVAMLKNIEMMSKPFRMQGVGSADLIPALKVKEFTFSSLSDAV
ncbi:MAG: TldD/PmbA family protein [Bacteroidetes bacterium]|nr:MAG: TldD/PmbA family protein [Bacteroidota bacterium]